MNATTDGKINEERGCFKGQGRCREGSRSGDGRTGDAGGVLGPRVQGSLSEEPAFQLDGARRQLCEGSEDECQPEGRASESSCVWWETWCSALCHRDALLPGPPRAGHHHCLSCLCSDPDVSPFEERSSSLQVRFQRTTPTLEQDRVTLPFCGSGRKLTCHQHSYQ